MMNDPLANILSMIKNYEKIGRKEMLATPASKLVKSVLSILNSKGYIGKYEEVTAARGGVLKVHLLGAINAVGVIKPRFGVKMGEYEKFEKRFLPAKDVGVLIVSTSQGLMTHLEAKEKKTGGRLLAYCY